MVEEALVDNFGARLGGDVAAQIHVQLSCNFQIVGRPGVAHGIEQADAASARDCDQRIIGGSIPIPMLQRLEVHAGERANHLQVAELFRPNIHQQVFAIRIFTIETLYGVLHGGGEFAVGSAELFQKHIAEPGVRRSDIDGVHELFDVVIHGNPFLSVRVVGWLNLRSRPIGSVHRGRFAIGQLL